MRKNPKTMRRNTCRFGGLKGKKVSVLFTAILHLNHVCKYGKERDSSVESERKFRCGNGACGLISAVLSLGFALPSI